MSLQLVVSSKSIDRSRFLIKWQNILTLVALFLMPLQRHFRIHFFEDPILIKQHPYNTLFCSFLTPVVVIWLLLQLVQVMTVKKTEVGKLLLPFIPLCLIALCLREHTVLGLFHLYRVAELTVLLAMFWRWMESEGANKVRKHLFQSALFLGVFESILMCLQVASGKSVGLRFLGETRFDIEKVKSSYILHTPGSILKYFDFLHLPEKFIRAPGTAPHPNLMGGILAIYLLMLLCSETMKYQSGLKTSTLKQQWRMPIILSLLFTALLMTFSRSALFGFGIGFCLIGSYLLLHRLISRKVVLFLGLIMMCLSPMLMARGGILLNSNEIIEECNQERMHMIKTSFKMFWSHPITGVGAGEYVTQVSQFPQLNGRVVYEPAHNIFCLVLAEMGIIGLVSMGMVLRRYCIFKRPKTYLEWGALSSLLAMLFIANCDHYLLTFPEGRILAAVALSWYALEFHFARLKFFESSSPK